MFVGILGPLVVTDGGAAVPVGGARLRALVARLALEPGRTVTGDALVRAVWPDGGPGDPAHALQALVSRLRRSLPDGRVRSEPGGYLLDVAPDAVDAHRFERLAREGARALRGGDGGRAATLLGEALGLWRGDPLADAGDAPFAAAEAVRLRELRLAATEDRIAAELAAGAGPGALAAELEGLAARHPLRERVRALLVRALHRDGRPAEALAVYEEFRRVLADELGADPGDEARAAYLDVLRVPRARPRGNLRAPATGFVGREDECAWIARRLWDGRLVTLVGPGGAGKTRLATTVAERVAERFPGGVWVVELAAVAAGGEVPGAVAAALGVRGPERVAEALAGAAALLVLDNCEHVLDAAADLAGGLLGACPELRVLATGRERLGIDGEALCPVPPLDGPDAARLFAERAAAVRPGFDAAESAAAVAEICRRLDGLPLAIELAAARLRAMTPEQLVHRLGERFRLLTGGRAAPRHRTLRAVVAWSWDLLDERERAFAERLAVFPGVIVPDAAARVGGGTLEDLDALADRSLLQPVDGGEPRFRMLETIREYARERLAERGESAAVRAAHLAYVVEAAERAAPHLLGAGQVAWLPRLTEAQDDVHAALRFAEERGDAGSAVRLAAALAVFWTIQGDHAEAARRLKGALETPRRTPVPDGAEAAALGGYVLNVVLAGGAARDDPLIEARAPGPDARPLAVLVEPGVALLRDDAAGGRAAVDRLLPGRDAWTRGTLHVMAAMLDGNAGDLAAAHRDLAAAVAAYRESGERAGLAMALLFASSTELSGGDHDAAVAALEESIGLLRELGQEREAARQRVMLAVVLARSGDAGRARRELAALLAPEAATPARHLVGARLALGDLARHGGDPAEAERHYAAAERELERAPSGPQYPSLLATARAHLAIGAGERAAARRHLRAALAGAVAGPDMPVAASAGVGVARLRAADRPADAAAALGAASVLRGGADEADPDVAHVARGLRDALGERAFEDARARGAALDLPGALALLEDQLRRR
ncbi:BTAD domain-containing putative transcriptional regulator [Actinomadura rifamycini]|uniref:BTAD domain-containing putative transcriptional regulator n=1 Tax=Actinomadura rifamycini TaxID=31962 RepID=UPI0004050940|nr:BTAD domain-containing putative transcriptional regulator [Actinomadura rifamycini]